MKTETLSPESVKLLDRRSDGGHVYSTGWTGSAAATTSIRKILEDAGYDVVVEKALTNTRYIKFDNGSKYGEIRIGGHAKAGDIERKERTVTEILPNGVEFSCRKIYFELSTELTVDDESLYANVMTASSYENLKSTISTFIL